MSHADVIIKVIAFTLLCSRAEALRVVTLLWFEVAKQGHSHKLLMARWPLAGFALSGHRDTECENSVLGPISGMASGQHLSLIPDPHSHLSSYFKGPGVFALTLELPFWLFKSPFPSCHIACPHEWLGSSTWQCGDRRCIVIFALILSPCLCPCILPTLHLPTHHKKTQLSLSWKDAQSGKKPLQVLACSVGTPLFLPYMTCTSISNLQQLETDINTNFAKSNF